MENVQAPGEDAVLLGLAGAEEAVDAMVDAAPGLH